MKGITFLLSCLLCTPFLFAQPNKLKEITFTLPPRAEKLSNEKLKLYKVSSGKIRSVINRTNPKGDAYVIDGTLLQLNSSSDKILPSDWLEKMKAGTDEMIKSGSPGFYKSAIRNINNYRVLVVQYEFGEDVGYYDIPAVKNGNSSVFHCNVEYLKANRQATEIMVDSFLSSVRFH